MSLHSKRHLFVLILTLLIIVTAGCQKQSGPKEAAGSAPVKAPEAAAPAFPKTIKHGLGETTIPKKPLKIVTISHITLEDQLTALGVKPVGIPEYTNTPDKSYPYLKEAVKEVQTAGTYDNPNLETILTLQPDLIIGLKGYADKAYDQLSKIAPTVMYDTVAMDGDWRKVLLAIGDTIGEEAKAKQVLQDYDTKAQNYAQEIKKLAGDRGLAILFSIDDKGGIRLQGTITHALNDMIYKEIGLKPAKDVPTDKMNVMISLEQLSVMNPDMLLLPNRLYEAKTIWNYWGPLGRLEVFKELQAALGQ
jgi:iron complex transport system substrate-binding protein